VLVKLRKARSSQPKSEISPSLRKLKLLHLKTFKNHPNSSLQALSRSRKQTTQIVSYAVSFLVSLLIAITTPIVPILAMVFNASQFELGLIVGSASLVYVPTTLFAGNISDMFGRKRVIELSLILYSIALLIYYLSYSWYFLLFGKLLEGFSLAMLWSPIEALISNTSEDQTKANSIFGISWSLGSVLGSFISWFFLDFFGKKLAFLTNFFIVILCLSLFFLFSEDEPRVEKTSQIINFKLNVLQEVNLIVPSFMYSFTQGIVTSFYPAFVNLLALSNKLIIVSFTIMMLARTFTFYLLGKLGKAINKKIGSMLCLSILLLPFGTNTLYVAVVSSFLGFGLGVLYYSGLKEALNKDSLNKGKFTGLFESTIGMGYLISSFLGGIVAEINISYPYLLSFLVSIVAMLI
jgi:DHA1 family multidrug resistance protein-like MFS transporter